MLIGNFPARIDDKGRLKVPAKFHEELERAYKGEFWVSSTDDGKSVCIYPMEEWTKLLERIQGPSFSSAARRKFLAHTNFFGQIVKWDDQSRILIPAHLREAAEIKGEVAVLGGVTYLTVQNNGRFEAEIRDNPLTSEDLDALGI